MELAKRTATPLHLWEQSTILVDSKGQLVSRDTANKTLERVWDTLAKAVDYSATNTEALDPSKSLYDFFTAEYDSMVRDGVIPECEAALLLGMAHMWGAYVGDRVERQSLKFLFLEDCIEGGIEFFLSASSQILSAVTR